MTALKRITDENDYQICVRRARSVKNDDKNIICPNYKYVFHAELEINLNWNFSQFYDRWFLYFTEICLPPGWNSDDKDSAQVFTYPPDKLIIYHNAKIKYRCIDCSNEWTSARGRAIFQAEFPQVNKFNFLFANLCTQKCKSCEKDIQPSWYLNEATRVMKNVCRILIENFYSNQQFDLPRPSSPSSDDGNDQRISQTTGHHYQHLCTACQRGFCYRPHQQYKRRH